jgi:phospholipase/lecithinase/hemolysin
LCLADSGNFLGALGADAGTTACQWLWGGRADRPGISGREFPLLRFRAGHSGAVRSLVRLMAMVLLSGPAVLAARAAFNSIYIYGDTVSSTTTNQPETYYYGRRFTNGRTWVEVLAQRQAIPGNNTDTNGNWSHSTNNLSYYYHTSTNLVTEVSQFSATNAATWLFVVWVSDADLVGDLLAFIPDSNYDLPTWTRFINRSLTNHYKAITNLYAKGARTLLMPNAVDISKTPLYPNLDAFAKSFIRQRVIQFNTNFAAVVSQAMASLPGLMIYVPDFFALLDSMVANPAQYGLINPTNGSGNALDDGYGTPLTNVIGAIYIFWDYLDPTAKAQAVMADSAQQLLTPVTISSVTPLEGSNQLDVASLPIGLNGLVEAREELGLGTWASVTNFSSTNVAQTILVPATGAQQFYRLRFPLAWVWP